MDAQWFDNNEKDTKETSESRNSNVNIKLERRRRIEELNEERKLRDEFGEF